MKATNILEVWTTITVQGRGKDIGFKYNSRTIIQRRSNAVSIILARAVKLKGNTRNIIQSRTNTESEVVTILRQGLGCTHYSLLWEHIYK